MAESANSRNNTFDLLLYNVVASAIVIIGAFAFMYVGEQVSHGSSKANVTIEVPRTTP